MNKIYTEYKPKLVFITERTPQMADFNYGVMYLIDSQTAMISRGAGETFDLPKWITV